MTIVVAGWRARADTQPGTHRTIGSKRRIRISGNRPEDQYTVAHSCRTLSAQGIAPFLRWGVTGGDLIFNEVAPPELPVELIHLVSLLRRNVRKAESFQLIVAGLEIMPIDYGVHRQRMMRARVSKGNVAEQSPEEKKAEHPADEFHNEVTRHAMCGPIGVTVHRWYLVQLSGSLSARAVRTGWTEFIRGAQ